MMKCLDSFVLFQILCSVDPKLLKLTKYDDQLYAAFMKMFPEFPLRIIDETALKSSEAKDVGLKTCHHFN